MRIDFYNTYIDNSAKKNINSILSSTFLSEGKLVKEFEDKLSGKLGLSYPVAVNSGTSSLHLALVVAGIGSGDEVILPAQTFISTGLAVLYQRARPVFADIEYDTGNLDADRVEQKITGKTRAIMAVDWAGYPCDLDKLRDIAKKHNLVLIEDAAHALGAEYKNKKIGTVSDITCFSFQAIKHLTTGDGGALSILNQKIHQKAKALRWFGIDRANSVPSILGERIYDLKELGFKYHMNDYQAALGLANLTGFYGRLKKRRRIAAFYTKELANISGLKLFNYRKDRLSSYWLFGLHAEKREDFIRALKERGIPTSVVHQRIDKYSIFKGQSRLPNQEKFDRIKIHIPIHDKIGQEEAEYIVNSIKKGW